MLADGWDEHVTVYRDGADGDRGAAHRDARRAAAARGAARLRRASARRPCAPVERRRRRGRRLHDREAPSPRRVIDATILIPTFRHAALLPYALRSALDQEGASVEVFVVGDGVEDDTRAALEPFRDDERVRFFDFPKGERHGELHRHEALREATRAHRLLPVRRRPAPARPRRGDGSSARDADFAHSVSARLAVDGTLEYFPWNFSRPEFVRGRPRPQGVDRADRHRPHARGVPPAAARVEDHAARRADRPLHVAAVARAARVPRRDERSAHVPDLSRSMVGTAPAGGARRSARRLAQALARARLRGGAGRSCSQARDPARG